MKRVLSLVLCLTMILSLSLGAFAVNTAPQVLPSDTLDGIWEGSLPVFSDKGTYFNDVVTINIDSSSSKPVLLRITSMGAGDMYIEPKAYQMYNGVLNFELYDDSWYSVAQLRQTEAGIMQGTYSQKARKMPIEFKLISKTPVEAEKVNTEFLFDGENESYWLSELKKYPSYEEGKKEIPFTYELNQWEKNLPLINMYGLDKIMDGRSDIELMETLMQIVNDNFNHDGTVAISDRCDPLSIIALHNEKGGVECRGLAIILSEMLRTCRIEAKPVMCISSKEPAECHVVVHAYSESLNQWIMLDPTYNLILKDKDGKYLDLPHLRQALINNEPIHANDKANYNGTPFYMPRYREYMAKNTFRFASAQDFFFGAKIFPKTDAKGDTHGDAKSLFGEEASKAVESVVNYKNPIYMLVPKGYKVPFASSREEIITTDDEAFWALPERSKEIAEKLAAQQAAAPQNKEAVNK